jgi:AMP deaminase
MVDTRTQGPAPQEMALAQPSSPSHATTHTAGTKSVFEGPSSESAPQWPADGLGDPHLSGHEPRYFPGMMARASRRGSMRQGTVQETEDVTSTRNPRNRSAGREDSA